MAYVNGHKYEYNGSRDEKSLSEFIKKTVPASSHHESHEKTSKTSKTPKTPKTPKTKKAKK
jgi:hypothetical protein